MTLLNLALALALSVSGAAPVSAMLARVKCPRKSMREESSRSEGDGEGEVDGAMEIASTSVCGKKKKNVKGDCWCGEYEGWEGEYACQREGEG
jgi:hypothetical protein